MLTPPRGDEQMIMICRMSQHRQSPHWKVQSYLRATKWPALTFGLQQKSKIPQVLIWELKKKLKDPRSLSQLTSTSAKSIGKNWRSNILIGHPMILWSMLVQSGLIWARKKSNLTTTWHSKISRDTSKNKYNSSRLINMKASSCRLRMMETRKNKKSHFMKMVNSITIRISSCTDHILPKMPFRHRRTLSRCSGMISKLHISNNTSKSTNIQLLMRECQVSLCRHHSRIRLTPTPTFITNPTHQDRTISRLLLCNHGQVKLDLHLGSGLKHCIMNLIMVPAIVNSLMKTNLKIWWTSRITTMISTTAIPPTTPCLTFLMISIRPLKPTTEMSLNRTLLGAECRETKNSLTGTTEQLKLIISYPNTNDKLTFEIRM